MSLTDINNKLNEITLKLNQIQDKLNELENVINKNNSNCEKMSTHIDFVNNIYYNMKSPLEYICNKITYGVKLPQIQHND
jgi:peptidoglycan hydrolase CwlO-like protein